MLLGNAFDDQLYIDRYLGFKANYEKMYDENKECSTCEVKNLCYQCPAGNMATSGKLFRPDGMCKRIITLYSEINELMMENKYRRKVDAIKTAMAEEGEVVISRALVHLIHYFFEDMKADPEEVKKVVQESGVTHTQLLGYFNHMIEWADRPDTVKDRFYDPATIVSQANEVNKIASPGAVYEMVRACEGLPPAASYDKPLVEIIAAMHFLIMNQSEIRKRS
jgi:hypothetical protein